MLRTNSTSEARGSALATAHAGVNTNLLADETAIDPPSGNAILNGIPVTIRGA